MSYPKLLGVKAEPAEPLWKRAPTRGDDGQPLSDFMMLIPGMRHWPGWRRQSALEAIYEVLNQYRNVVVFADMNVRLNLLWVSVRAVPGICMELPIALRARVPQAKLVSHRAS